LQRLDYYCQDGGMFINTFYPNPSLSLTKQALTLQISNESRIIKGLPEWLGYNYSLQLFLIPGVE
jgi:hypothetical protein